LLRCENQSDRIASLLLLLLATVSVVRNHAARIFLSGAKVMLPIPAAAPALDPLRACAIQFRVRGARFCGFCR
jgi:hypothetical protein